MREQHFSLLLYSLRNETHNSDFLPSGGLMRFIENGSHFCEHSWRLGIHLLGATQRIKAEEKADKYQTCCGGNQRMEVTNAHQGSIQYIFLCPSDLLQRFVCDTESFLIACNSVHILVNVLLFRGRGEIAITIVQMSTPWHPHPHPFAARKLTLKRCCRCHHFN